MKKTLQSNAAHVNLLAHNRIGQKKQNTARMFACFKQFLLGLLQDERCMSRCPSALPASVHIRTCSAQLHFHLRFRCGPPVFPLKRKALPGLAGPEPVLAAVRHAAIHGAHEQQHCTDFSMGGQQVKFTWVTRQMQRVSTGFK